MPQTSTMQPFAQGDVFAGATVLNNAEDDHAGDGRILQYDSDLNEKGVLWTEGTTHLVGGLKFGPDGNLWAFDSNTFTVIRVSPDGKQLPRIAFPERAFSNINFGPDGTVLLGEHLVGDTINLPPDRPLGTTLPHVPGTKVFGYGHVYRCAMDGSLVKEYATEVHGGMPGFLGVTSSALAPDGKTLVYLSELGNRVFRFDIEADKQLPDLVHFDPETRDMAMHVKFDSNGRLFLITANFQKGFFLHIIDDQSGKSKQSWELPGRGWATITPSTHPNTVYIGNFFTGTIGRFSLDSGSLEKTAETKVERSLAGLAQYGA